MYRLAHLSDIHLGPMPDLTLRELASKRVTGWINWQRNRRRVMFGDTLITLLDDLKAEAPDHVAVTGDLVNLATRIEIAAARLWLQKLGRPHDVSVVPGNHDAYVLGAFAKSCRAWSAYVTGDAHRPLAFPTFPYARYREEVAIYGVSTAEATAPFFATGTFGRRQALDLAQMLRSGRDMGYFRVVLIHHPPISGAASWHKRLIGKQYFSKVIRDVGAELVLHGHTHLDTLHWLHGPDGHVPVVGVPSASQSPGGEKPASRYNLFEISGGPGAWELVQRERGARVEAPGIDWIRERQLLSNGTAVNATPRKDARPAREPA
ncbi:metallophosphoesterase [Aurantimonas sp. Leaf443]|uniref:metallophosphoesterase family protein n=1 Tax=Aurantimonas sp. Leaf443 TaxID=1736378 RepID=UPI0006FFAE30|nr:metallophosphoesterase [Aurantimonas sp. Leaf443]KQT82502.1 metallophosphatase [Aurantimonas sp. Leaf443]